MYRAGAILKARNKTEVKLLQHLHNGGVFPAPSHLVDFSRPSYNIALPRVFFHANGDAEVGWRKLLAALLPENEFRYQTYWKPVSFNSGGYCLQKASVDDQTQVEKRKITWIVPDEKERSAFVCLVNITGKWKCRRPI